MHLSTRNPVVLGLIAAAIAAVVTAIAGGNTDVAYISLLVLVVVGLVYMVWPEIRESRRHGPHEAAGGASPVTSSSRRLRRAAGQRR
jgi:peptidoglycan/LPS O-acetylase OafA/YrhL